jgi:hypothetical protein
MLCQLELQLVASELQVEVEGTFKLAIQVASATSS